MPGEKKIDSLFIELLLETTGMKKDLDALKEQVATLAANAKPALDTVDAGLANVAEGAKEATQETQKLESNLQETAVAAKAGGAQAAQGVNRLTRELNAADQKARSLTDGIRQRFSGWARSFLPMLIGAGALMQVFRGVGAELGELNELMNTADLNAEQLARKQELLNIYGVDGAKRYREVSEAMTNFRKAMIQAAWPIIEVLLPALAKLAKVVSSGIETLRKHEPLFKTIIFGIAAAITAVLIPSIISMGTALWASLAPALPIILPLLAAFAVLAILVDDFITYLEGGNSALEDVWKILAEGETYAERVDNALRTLGEAFQWLKSLAEIFLAPIVAIFDLLTGGIDAVVERLKGNKFIQLGASLLGLDLEGNELGEPGVGGTSARAGMYGGTLGGDNLVPAMVASNAPQAAGIRSDVGRGNQTVNSEQNNNITVYAKSDNPQGIADETVKALGSKMALTSESGMRR